MHDGVKTLRGPHPPGNDQAEIGHAKGDAQEDHMHAHGRPGECLECRAGRRHSAL